MYFSQSKVSFQSVWGTFHDIYPHMDSRAEDEGPLPAGIIDPDAVFAVWWNLVQVWHKDTVRPAVSLCH